VSLTNISKSVNVNIGLSQKHQQPFGGQAPPWTAWVLSPMACTMQTLVWFSGAAGPQEYHGSGKWTGERRRDRGKEGILVSFYSQIY